MRVSILMVRALVGVLERAGASRERFLSEAHIEPQWIADGTRWLSLPDYVRCVDAALSVSGDPAFGLHLGEQARAVMFDVVGPVAEHAETVRKSIEAIMRYSRLVAQGYEPVLHEQGDQAVLRFPFRGDFLLVRVTSEFVMTSLLSMLRMFVGDRALPSEVSFAYAAPGHQAEYQRIFGDRARFGRDHTELVFPRAWLDKGHPYRNPELYAVLETQAERSLDRLARDAPLRERIEQVLARLGTQPPSMEEVARELGVSARSLRRRLLAQGLSFTDLVTRSRTSTAKRMLERPGASIQDTAYAMGFSSAASFHRAFKRWTGVTPKQYQESF